LPRGSSAVYYPVQLDVHGAPVLVVGGGDVGLRKVRGLLDAGALVTVVSPELHPDFAALRAHPAVKLVNRRFRANDLAHKRLVFAATDDTALNRAIASQARRRGVWVNVAAPPEDGDFLVPSHFRRGSVLVAISTGGASAALARSLREKLEAALGAEWGVAAELLEARRARIHRDLSDAAARRALLLKLGQRSMVTKVKTLGRAGAGREMDRMIRDAIASSSRKAARTGRQSKRKVRA
jgi:precorrin-2 dehydrogenase / sirohydrochlorin ferrochelatase